MKMGKCGIHLMTPDSICGPSVHHGKLFLRLAQQAVAVESVPYAGLVKGVREGRSRKYKTLG